MPATGEESGDESAGDGADTTTGIGGTGGGPGEPAETTGVETSGGTNALPPAGGADEGCGCRSSGGPSGWALILVGLLGLRRRRR